ncbi:uncharacterized protein LOC121370058 [Gigantopelta aegis]|uniref:uncharacterized protein LOC121370058 n=1 Tax=Gigantopelta aegis TaxID=1735272 RepID=UPI001B8886C9|nr:uncharacterized protein LOC121370058 [Gigantopelta aegis]
MSSDSDTDNSPPAVPVPHIKAPGPLILSSENVQKKWSLWKQMWDNYVIVSRLSAHTEQYKIALFLVTTGQEALEIYNGFEYEDGEDRTQLDVIIHKFDKFFAGEINEIYERYIFNQRNQKIGETFDAYYASLKYLAKTCNCGDLHDSLIRDRIVLGIQDNTTRKRLLQERKLTLKTCSDICKSDEAASTQMGAIATPSLSEEIHKLQSRRTKPAQNKSRSAETRFSSSENKKLCKFCGKRHVFQKKLCAAWGKSCSKCKQMNHFAVKCPQTKVHHIDDGSNTVESDCELIQSVGDSQKTVFAKMEIAGKPVKFQIDSGSSVNILPKKFVKNTKLRQTEMTLKMWNKSNLNPLGTCRTILKNPANRKTRPTANSW